MTSIRARLWAASLGAAMALIAFGAPSAQAAQRVEVTGEVIDSWCYLTEIMYPEGTAHHLCAIWCAAGGIPVGILADDGTVYIVLKFEDDATSVANPAVMAIQSHRVRVEGDLAGGFHGSGVAGLGHQSEAVVRIKHVKRVSGCAA